MRTIKGPALFIAQLAGDRPPFNTLPGIAKWAAGLGYKGLQLPSSDPRFLDLRRCAESQTYADEITGILKSMASRPPNCRPRFRASSSRCILPMTPSATLSRRRACRGIPRRVRPGRSRK